MIKTPFTTPMFTIIVVAFNAGEKLNKTLESIAAQTYRDFEIVVKDGGSKDGSIERIREQYRESIDAATYPCMTLIEGADKGIYDAMNIALDSATGKYVIFMNCGDTFYTDTVLAKAAERIAADESEAPAVFYGDIFSEKADTLIPAPGQITGFTCFRNIPCHQACFYSRELFEHKRYNPEYRVRADYDHFLWCFYKCNARFEYLGFPIAAYEGGGYSESAENRERDKYEHDIITREYMTKGELFRYKAVLGLTLAPVRRSMAESKIFGKAYQTLKQKAYKRKTS